MAERRETMVGGFKKIGADVGCEVGIFYDWAMLTFGVWTFSARCQDLGCCLDRRVKPMPNQESQDKSCKRVR